jgi:hypothetical protein
MEGIRLYIPEFFKRFAEDNRFRIRKDPCGNPWILGMFGHFFVYEEKSQLIGVCLERKGDASAKNRLRALRPKHCVQECDFEAIWAVSVNDREFLKVAKKTLEARSLPRVTKERKEQLRQQMSSVRSRLAS